MPLREVRVAVAALLGVVVIALAGLQVMASVALRDRAQRGSWVTLVPPADALRIVAFGDRLPLPQTLRLVFARSALSAGDVARAEAQTGRLEPSPDRLALLAALARTHGDADTAVRDDFGAGDYASLARDLDVLASRGELVRALALQHAAVARLAADPTRADALAEAQYHLGIFEQARADTFAVLDPLRRTHEAAAARAYARAVALGPLDERYLLAAANQALNMADWETAANTFARARQVDPTSADPLAGLGDLALRRGDPAAADAYLAQAKALEPRSAAVVRLARKLGR